MIFRNVFIFIKFYNPKIIKRLFKNKLILYSNFKFELIRNEIFSPLLEMQI